MSQWRPGTVSGGGGGSSDRLVSSGQELVLIGSVPKVTFPAKTGKNISIEGSEISATGGDVELISNTARVQLSANASSSFGGTRKDWVFDATGRLTLPTGGIIRNNDGSLYGVTKIIAGTNITISPTDGLGEVTINSTATGGGFNGIADFGTFAVPGGINYDFGTF